MPVPEGPPPIAVLVISHGGLALELVATARRIVGDLPGVEGISMGWGDEVEAARARIEGAVRRLGSGEGVLLLTDMFGGTPSNIALSFLDKGRVEVVTGVNLPMLVRLAGLRQERDLQAVAEKVRSQGQRSITLASEVLAQSGG